MQQTNDLLTLGGEQLRSAAHGPVCGRARTRNRVGFPVWHVGSGSNTGSSKGDCCRRTLAQAHEGTAATRAGRRVPPPQFPTAISRHRPLFSINERSDLPSSKKTKVHPRRNAGLLPVCTRGSQHKSTERNLACQWPKRPEEIFCHRSETWRCQWTGHQHAEQWIAAEGQRPFNHRTRFADHTPQPNPSQQNTSTATSTSPAPPRKGTGSGTGRGMGLGTGISMGPGVGTGTGSGPGTDIGTGFGFGVGHPEDVIRRRYRHRRSQTPTRWRGRGLGRGPGTGRAKAVGH